MFKWLLIGAGAYLFYRWFKGKQNPKTPAKPDPIKAASILEPELMVQCQYCKVHLPKADAIANDQRFYCSSDHLQSLDEQGWLGSAQWRDSPNQDVRPENIKPDLLVLHHISLPPGAFKTQDSSQFIIDFFQNKLDFSRHPYFAEIEGQKVSSHFLITRSGRLIQFVSTKNKAWHAGLSSFLGREKCNDFSIGIELEGDGDTPFEEIQYKVLSETVGKLNATYANLRFAGHSDIAPERKTDPGISFDWKRFQKETGLSLDKLPYGLTSR